MDVIGNTSTIHDYLKLLLSGVLSLGLLTDYLAIVMC